MGYKKATWISLHLSCMLSSISYIYCIPHPHNFLTTPSENEISDMIFQKDLGFSRVVKNLRFSTIGAPKKVGTWGKEDTNG